jgi:hypothetical protein
MADTMYIPDCGKNKIVEMILGKDLAENITLKLFVDNETIGTATVAGDFTEMTTHGYSAKTLTMGSWGAPLVGGDAYSSSSYAAQTWTFTAAAVVSVYGYYCVMATTGTLLWACKFASAKPITYTNEQITVTPQFKFTIAT